MSRQPLALALGLLAAGLAGCSSSGSSEPGTLTPTVDPVMEITTSQMPDVCKREAAEKFNQKPTNIQTMPAKQNRGTYTVDGQYPPKVRDATRFSCLFSSGGKLMSIDPN